MKRFLAFCFAFSFLFLFGCSSGGKTLEPKDLNFIFSCRADATCPSGEFICEFCRSGQEDATVEILSGNGKGLKWYWNGSNFTATYCGLSAQSGTCALPDDSFPALLVAILDCAEKPGALAADGQNTFSGSLKGCEFQLTANGKTGIPETLSVPDRELKVSFQNSGIAQAETVVPTNLR